MKFNDNLVKLRKAKGWSQEDLADKLGLSRQAISKWEVGSSKPDIDNVIKLSKLFSISIDELVNNEIVKTEAISIKVKKKDKKQKLLVWLRRLMVVLVILYTVNTIYKFVMLFRITKAEQKYEQLNNYHYVITTYDNNGLKEKEECWFKDGVSKTINTIKNGDNLQEQITYINYNTNEGYIEDKQLNSKTNVDVVAYENLHKNHDEGGQLYSKFPSKMQRTEPTYLISIAMRTSEMSIKVYEEDIFLNWENDCITLNRNDLLPISVFYEEKNKEDMVSTFFNIELNCVNEIKI